MATAEGEGRGRGRGGRGRGRGRGRQKAEGRGAGGREDGLDFGPPLQRRGLFAAQRADICPLRNLMYGHGDVLPEHINQDTVNLVEDIVIDYCSSLMQRAVDQASLRGNKLQAEDILFLMRKDPKKYARCKELLSMNEEIKQARKQFEEDDAMMKGGLK